MGKGNPSFLLQRVPQEVAQPATPTRSATSGQSTGANRTIVAFFRWCVLDNIHAGTTSNRFAIWQERLRYGHRVGNSLAHRGLACCSIRLTSRSTGRRPA